MLDQRLAQGFRSGARRTLLLQLLLLLPALFRQLPLKWMAIQSPIEVTEAVLERHGLGAHFRLGFWIPMFSFPL